MSAAGAPLGPAPEAVVVEHAPRSARFRREREESWRELDALVGKVEKSGVSSLTEEEIHRLPSLYRATASSLSVARSTSLDRNLLEYLTALVGRAYICVYSPRRRALEAISEFIAWRFPRAVRSRIALVASAFGLLLAGTLCGFWLTLSDPERFDALVPASLAQGRDPAATTADLRKVLYSKGGGWPDELNLFATFLFTHNSQIALMAFALGFAAGAPVVYLLFTNGISLGAMAALYQSRGLGLDFWCWTLPHGVTELGAIGLCGAAGLSIGLALIFPGRHSRLQNLAIRGREVSTIVIGAVGMLFIAALLEGFFRQLVTWIPARAAVAILTFFLWAVYFTFAGRKGQFGDRR